MIGTICCAKFNNCFYRSKIIDVHEDKKCVVHLIDYGNVITVRWNEIHLFDKICGAESLLSQPANEDPMADVRRRVILFNRESSEQFTKCQFFVTDYVHLWATIVRLEAEDFEQRNDSVHDEQNDIPDEDDCDDVHEPPTKRRKNNTEP